MTQTADILKGQKVLQMKSWGRSQGLIEKFFQGVRRSMPGPQISPDTKVYSDVLPKVVNFSPIFSPKLGEDQKKKSSLKISPIFPKVGEDQKKRSSQNFSPIFPQNLVKTRPKKLSAGT